MSWFDEQIRQRKESEQALSTCMSLRRGRVCDVGGAALFDTLDDGFREPIQFADEQVIFQKSAKCLADRRGIHPVAVAGIVDRNVIDLEFFPDRFVKLPGLHICFEGVAGELCEALSGQVGIERLVAHCDDDRFFAPFVAVQGSVVQAHIPGSRVGLKSVSAVGALS